MHFERILSGLILMVLAGAPSAFGGDWLGWHAKNHYGTCDPCPEDVWEDMTEDVYGDDTMEKLYHDPHNLFHLGQGSWNCRGCRYAPLHYHQLRSSIPTSPASYAGSSWYRGVPVGQRDKTPLAGGAGEYDKSEVVP